MISVDNVGVEFSGHSLFSDVSFSINENDKIALMGTNGSGKSSLLKVLLGELEPIKGQLRRLDGLDIGHFSQKRESLPNDITPWQLVGEGIDFVMSNTGEKRHVASYLDGFLFKSEEIKRPIHTFSGGEKNRLQLAQFMKHARDLWIFDEPTNDLDVETLRALEEALLDFAGCAIVISHDRWFLDRIATHMLAFEGEGHVEWFEGNFEEYEADKKKRLGKDASQPHRMKYKKLV